jgi:hypothetical protein
MSEKHSGLWWIPSAPDEAHRGELTVGDGSRPALDLFGAFAPIGGNFTFEAAVIWGLTSKGERITLFECSQTNHHFNTNGIEESKFAAQFAFVGAHLDGLDRAQFSKLRVRFSNLEEWAWLSGFTFTISHDRATNEFQQYSLSYSHADPVDINIAGGTLRFHHALHVDGGTGLRHGLTQTIHWEYQPHEPSLFQDMFDGVFYHLQNFLTLAVGRGVYPLSIEAVSAPDAATPEHEPRRDTTSSVHFAYRGAKTADYSSIHPARMLFHRPALGDSYADAVAKWLERSEELRPVVDLYFSTLFAESQYLESRFLTMSQALETYHRRRIGGEYLELTQWDSLLTSLTRTIEEADMPRDAADALRGKLRYMNEVSLRRRIREIVARAGAAAEIMGAARRAFH